MPPKKIDKAPKKATEKKPRSRQKKVKPVLKTPTVIKVKLQPPTAASATENTGSEVPVVQDVNEAKESAPKVDTLTKKRCVKKKTVNRKQAVTKKAPVKRNNQRKGAQKIEELDGTKLDISQIDANYYKILLANDVINMQFPSIRQYICNKLKEDESQENKTIAVKKQTCNTKNVNKKKVTNGRIPAKKKQIQRRKLDPAKKNTPIENGNHAVEKKKTYKRKTVPKKPPNESKPNLTLTNKSNDNGNIGIDTSNSDHSLKRKRNVSLKWNKNILTKTEIRDSNCIKKGEEIYTENLGNNNQEITNKSLEDKSQYGDNIEQASVSSLISWTKDISTSSNSSSVTAHSNSFYCFNNKMPVVKLKKIKNNKENSCANGNKSSKSDFQRVFDNSGAVVESLNRPGHKNCTTTFKSTASSLSRLSSDQADLNLCSEQNRINNCSAVINENVGDITQTSLHTSTSSSSSNSSSSSSSSSSDFTSDFSASMISKKNIENKLSSEKLHENKTSEAEKNNMSIDNEYKMTLQRLALSIKNHQINILKMSKNHWTNQKIFLDKNCALKEETQIVNIFCKKIDEIEIDDDDDYLNRIEHQETNISGPVTPETYYSKNSEIIIDSVNRNELCVTQNINHQQYSPGGEGNGVIGNKETEKIDDSCYVGHNKTNYNNSCDNDDEDALSLYAESLTGLESCKKNSTINSERIEPEEYIPQPVDPCTELPRLPISYQPTKISKNIENEVVYDKNKEQHDTNSTALLKDFNNYTDKDENMVIYEDRKGNISEKLTNLPNTDITNMSKSIRPRLMSLNYRRANGLKSLIFKGYCFFHIIANCRKPICKFSHEHPNELDVQNTLAKLSEEGFIQEYMLIRGYKRLLRKYGLCFVKECIRRELTRILVEIAIDFVVNMTKSSTVDYALKSDIIDSVLMYLNRVNLSNCADLLVFKTNIKHADRYLLLCDYFMSVIASSQNFSRFKPVFVNLTDFICRNQRTFSVDVAESILERLCILPYDDSLALALINILKNTDVTIFSNAKVAEFERQLHSVNSYLFEKFILLKNQALIVQPVLDNHYEQFTGMDSDRMNANFRHQNKNIIEFSSSNMANLGNQSNPVKTMFNRTININNIQRLKHGINTNTHSNFGTLLVQNQSVNWTKPGGLSNGQLTNTSNDATNPVKKWRHNVGHQYKKNLNASLPAVHRAPFKRRCDRTFEGSVAKFMRHSGNY